MRHGMSETRATTKRAGAVLAVAGLLSGLLVFVAQPSGATVTTKITATCSSPDPEATTLIKAIDASGTISAPLDVTVDAPAFVEPGQTGVPVSVTYALSLSADLVDKAAAVTDSLSLSAATVNTTVSGPTSTKVIPGAPADRTITLVKGQALSSSFDPFTGTLNDIGQSGVIKLISDRISFTMSLTVAGAAKNLPLQCESGATLATIPVKVAGSPDITQPINLQGTAGQDLTVDVLGQYTKAGVSKDGVTQPVDPNTLKVIDGPGKVVAGKVVIPSPSAGANSDTTFQVCAGTIEVVPAVAGVSEVQTLTLEVDPNALLLRRPIGMQFQLGDDATKLSPPFWTAKYGITAPLRADQWITDPAPTDWDKQKDPYFFSAFEFPPPENLQKVLEAMPNVGAGNVEVTELSRSASKIQYQVAFVNGMAGKFVPKLSTGSHFWSILPQEWLAGLLGAAKNLGGGGTTATTAPPNNDWLAYSEKLHQEALALLPDVNAALAKQGESILAALNDPGTQAKLLAFLQSLFTPTPLAEFTVKGVDPIAAQTQVLCSQGVVSVKSASVQGATTVPGGGSGDGTGNTGGAAIKITG
jgi:hypothetical protein